MEQNGNLQKNAVGVVAQSMKHPELRTLKRRATEPTCVQGLGKSVVKMVQ